MKGCPITKLLKREIVTYEVVMNLVGPNGKAAKVLTGWIDDKNNGEMRLTTVHIDR